MRTAHLSTLIAGLLLAPLASAANLLVNGSFEDGLSGWAVSGNAAIRQASPLAFDGTNYVFGSATPQFTVTQDIDLLANGFTGDAIDSGSLSAQFGGYQAGFSTQTDAGRIALRQLDAQGAELGVTELPFFFSNAEWVEQAGTAALLAQTRFLRFDFLGVRVTGSNNDAYLDAAFVDVAPVPLPATLPLLAAALGVLARRQRRVTPTA